MEGHPASRGICCPGVGGGFCPFPLKSSGPFHLETGHFSLWDKDTYCKETGNCYGKRAWPQARNRIALGGSILVLGSDPRTETQAF